MADSAVTPLHFSVDLVDTEGGFNRLEPVWNSLLWASQRPVPFLTWEWIHTWWRHFRGTARLFVIAARDCNGNVVGLAPLRIVVRKGYGVVPVRSLELLGYHASVVGTDHLDFLTATENREAIVRRLLEEIFARHSEWDTLVLGGLAEESLLRHLFARTEPGGIVVECPGDLCPYVNLSAGWEPLLRGMKKKRRSFVKCRRERLMQNHRVSFTVNSSVESVRQCLETLGRLHGLSRRRKAEEGNFSHTEYRDFHHDLAERMARAGYLYLAQLDCDDKPVAALYGFHVGRVLFDYQKGYDPEFAAEGVGAVLQGMVIQDAIERLHAAEFDFLGGAEDYKFFWTEHARRTFSIHYWKRDVLGVAAIGEWWLRRHLGPQWRRLQRRWCQGASGGV